MGVKNTIATVRPRRVADTLNKSLRRALFQRGSRIWGGMLRQVVARATSRTNWLKIKNPKYWRMEGAHTATRCNRRPASLLTRHMKLIPLLSLCGSSRKNGQEVEASLNGQCCRRFDVVLSACVAELLTHISEVPHQPLKTSKTRQGNDAHMTPLAARRRGPSRRRFRLSEDRLSSTRRGVRTDASGGSQREVRAAGERTRKVELMQRTRTILHEGTNTQQRSLERRTGIGGDDVARRGSGR